MRLLIRAIAITMFFDVLYKRRRNNPFAESEVLKQITNSRTVRVEFLYYR